MGHTQEQPEAPCRHHGLLRAHREEAGARERAQGARGVAREARCGTIPKKPRSDATRKTIAIFRKYGAQYNFDPIMVAAQGYQESRLDQTAKSHVGAIGVVQAYYWRGRIGGVLMPPAGQGVHVPVTAEDLAEVLEPVVERVIRRAPMPSTPEARSTGVRTPQDGPCVIASPRCPVCQKVALRGQ